LRKKGMDCAAIVYFLSILATRRQFLYAYYLELPDFAENKAWSGIWGFPGRAGRIKN